METQEKRLDEAHAPGGFFRVGERVVDAEGKDLGDDAVTRADEIDAEAKDKAQKDSDKAKQEQALVGVGGLAAALQTLAAAQTAPATAAPGKRAVTKPAAASQETKPDKVEPETPPAAGTKVDITE